MSWQRLRKMVQRILFLPARADRDLDDEIRFHLAEETRLLADRGLSEEEAAASARRAFGNVVLAKEETRAVWVATRLEQVLQDLRFGCRILTKSPGVSLTATVLIALVIGGNTTVFSIAHSVLTKPSPGVHAPGSPPSAGSRKTATSKRTPTVRSTRISSSTAPRSIRSRRSTSRRLTLTLDSGSYAVRAGIVSPNYFDTLGVRLVKGRGFSTRRGGTGGASGCRRHRPSCVAELVRRHRHDRRAGGDA